MSLQDRKTETAGRSMPLWLGLAAAIVLLGTSMFGSHLPPAAMAPVASVETSPAAAKTEAAPTATMAKTAVAPTATAAATTTAAVATTAMTAAPAATPAPAAPAATVATAVAPAAPTTPVPSAADVDKKKAEVATVAATTAAPAPKPDVALDELMKPGTLPENVLGDAKAPITIVEYASMTCPHCADFHKRVFPELKTKYIDTGKARLVFREYPLDNLAAAVSELARCTGPMRYFAFVGTMFEHQAEWHTGDNDLPKLQEMAKQAGFTDESFKKCVADQALLTGITDVRTRANDKFSVDSTPTFFVNGVKLKGSHEVKDFEDIMTPFLKG